MPRYAIKIEYSGTPFVGWQRQADLPSVQGAIERALHKAQITQTPITGAGRTDTGVHALAQVAHFDTEDARDPFRLSEALNYHLKPQPVAITACARVGDDFHARFDALERHYLFRIIARRAPVIIEAGWVWQLNQPLDCAAMQQGAAHLVGKHDFTTFRSVHCQAASAIKTLNSLTISEHAIATGYEYRFRLSARSFLHNQVRSFVGSLVQVGRGKWAPDDVGAALRACDRSACGPVAPPQGLYLTGVRYDTDPFATP